MGRLAIAIAACCALLCACAAGAASAKTETVLVLHGRHVRASHERFLGRSDVRARPAAAGKKKKKRAPRGRATTKALDDLLAQGQIDQATHDARLASLRNALGAYKSLTGTRKSQMTAVIDNADAMAAAGDLTPSRLAAVFATLDANAQWWRNGPLLATGARVSVGDSPVIWQYYPGQGIQLQMLANFGKANALWAAHKASALRALLDQLVPLAADRGGWPAFEYYFAYAKGKPPWTSSISQGTAIQVLARAGQLLADPSLTALGQQALAAFEQPPPAGVREDTPSGPFYLIYSFAPDERVINAHLQALVGLYDFAQITGDPRALGLFQQGDAEAQAVLPSYDTGKWSLYDQNHESDLSYHNLVTGFLQNLCKRTATPIYCDTATRFKSYLDEPPTVTAASQRVRAGAPAKLSFSLDKISRVGVVVARGSQTIFATSAIVGRGDHFFAWSQPAAPGLYELRIRATDLAGNQSDPVSTTLRILKPRRAHRAAG